MDDFTVCLFGWKTQCFAFDHACHTFLLRGLAFGSRLLFAACAPNRTACGMLRFYSARVGIAIGTFSNVVRLSDFVGSLRASAFLCGDSDGAPRRNVTMKVPPEPPKKSRRRPESLLGGRTSLEKKSYQFAVICNAYHVRRNRVASRSCPSGTVTAYSRRYRWENVGGCAPPNLRQRAIGSLDSLLLIRGRVPSYQTQQ